jgi:hypothetical protein
VGRECRRFGGELRDEFVDGGGTRLAVVVAVALSERGDAGRAIS